MPSIPRSLLVVPVAAAFAAGLAGCGAGAGSGASGGGPDPADVMPKSSVLYVEGAVRPDGDQGIEVRRLAGKILRTEDPGQKIQDLIDQGLAKDGRGETYAKDIEPWLGRRVGVGVTSITGDEPGFIVALATKDADAARTFVRKEAEHDKAVEHTYEDTTYYVDPSDHSVDGVDRRLRRDRRHGRGLQARRRHEQG